MIGFNVFLSDRRRKSRPGRQLDTATVEQPRAEKRRGGSTPANCSRLALAKRIPGLKHDSRDADTRGGSRHGLRGKCSRTRRTKGRGSEPEARLSSSNDQSKNSGAPATISARPSQARWPPTLSELQFRFCS